MRGAIGAPRPDLRLVPITVGTWAATWVGVAGSAGPGLLTFGIVGLVTGLVVLAGRRRSARLLAAAMAVAAGLAGGWLSVQRLASGPVAELSRERAVVRAVVVSTADPIIRQPAGSRPEYLMVRVRVREISARAQAWRVRAPVLVTGAGAAVGRWRDAPVGSTIVVSGRLEPPDPGSGLAAVLRLRGPASVRAPPGAGLALVERVRAGLRAAVADRKTEPRALVPALVLGDTSMLTEELGDDFRTTGLTHLTAVSGANLTLMLAFALAVARWAGVRGWWLRGVAVVGVAGFVGLCRTEPSVLRAAAMGLVALAALGSGSSRAGLRHLCVATTVLLLVDPQLSRSVGFALSVLASGGIVWWSRRWTQTMASWAPRWVAEGIAVPLAAHLATLPVVAALSAAVSMAGLAANALAGPFVGPATVAGFAAAGLSLISPRLAAAAGFAAAWSAQPILWVAHAGAGLPGAARTWPTTPLALAVLGAGAVSVGVGLAWLLARRWLVLVAAVVLIASWGVAPRAPGWPPREWVLVACDIGQGDGLVLRAGEQQAVVVDTGPDPEAMDRCLDQLGVRSIPLVVLTHFHADHVDGLPGVLVRRRVGQIWTSPYASPPAEAATVQHLATAAGVPVQSPPAGSSGAVGELTWEVLGPLRPPPTGPAFGGGSAESPAENDASLVLRITVAGVRILLTGDVEPAGQQALVRAGTDLSAEVLKVPHHGSARQDPDFLAATGARAAVASAGRRNDYGHPAPRTVARLQQLGMTVLHTDTQGAVAIVVRHGQLGAVTERGP